MVYDGYQCAALSFLGDRLAEIAGSDGRCIDGEKVNSSFPPYGQMLCAITS